MDVKFTLFNSLVLTFTYISFKHIIGFIMKKFLKYFLSVFILLNCSPVPEEENQEPLIPKNTLYPLVDPKKEEKNLAEIEQLREQIKQKTALLKQKALESIVFSEENISNANLLIEEPESTLDLFERTVTDASNDLLKTKYSRRQLSVLEDENLTSPEEELYEFLSPEGEFLEKNRAIYEKLRASNPYHEQGILARQCGLKKIMLADQEFFSKNIESAQTAYEFAKAMTTITSGELPLDKRRQFYETCTKKDILTGANIANNSDLNILEKGNN